MGLYTKGGRPLQVSGTTVYSRSGKVVGRIKNEKVYGTNGQYVGTITGDRLVYRSTDSASVSSSFTTVNRIGMASANRAGSAIWGGRARYSRLEEPFRAKPQLLAPVI
jgi:hypothetical protein